MVAISLIFCNIALATNTNNSSDDEDTSTTNSQTSSNTQSSGNRVNDHTTTNANSTAGVSTTQTGVDSSSLNISNILSVILIAVGALIIFLSIAILIRMNR